MSFSQSWYTFYRPYRTLVALRRLRAGLEFQHQLAVKHELPFSVYPYRAFHERLNQEIRRLDDYSVISHTRLRQLRIEFLRKNVREHSEFFFGRYIPRVGKYTRFERVLLDKVRGRCLSARKNELLFRAELAVTSAVRDGWFVLFNTLTVAPEHEATVFSVGSRAFSEYIRAMERKVHRAVHGSVRRGNGDRTHRYFAVVERGDATGKLHIHVVHLLKRLPDCCSDPNFGVARPVRREVDSLRELWQYGWSSPVACRFGPLDAYGRIGWSWPHDMVAGRLVPQRCSNSGAVAGYLTKYLTKDVRERRKDVWRVRMTRGLGVLELRSLLQTLNPETLMFLSLHPWSRRHRFKVRTRIIPLDLLRREAQRAWLKVMIRTNPKMIWSWMVALPPAPGLLSRVRDLIQRYEVHSCWNIGDIQTRNLKISATYEYFQALCNDAFGLVPRPLDFSGPSEVAL